MTGVDQISSILGHEAGRKNVWLDIQRQDSGRPLVTQAVRGDPGHTLSRIIATKLLYLILASKTRSMVQL